MSNNVLIRGGRTLIVIPVYRSLKPEEEFSLQNTLKVFHGHAIAFLCPFEFNMEPLVKKYPQVGIVRVSSDWLGTKRGILGYNEMMLSESFYSLFRHYEFLLICHVDAWVFHDDLKRWENMEVDHVGAPWPMPPSYSRYPKKLYFLYKTAIRPSAHYLLFNRVGNGGFSLRRVQAFIKVCQEHKSDIEHYKAHSEDSHNEDIYWSLYSKELRTPSTEEAYSFAFDCKPDLLYKLNNEQLPMAAHGYDKSKFFWEKFIPAPAFSAFYSQNFT